MSFSYSILLSFDSLAVLHDIDLHLENDAYGHHHDAVQQHDFQNTLNQVVYHQED